MTDPTLEPSATRIVSFAHSSVRIDAVGAEAVSLVAFLFDGVVPVAAPAPHVTLQVTVRDTRRSLHVDGVLYCERTSTASLAAAVLDQTLFHLGDRSSGGLLLHAAAVCVGPRTVLFPGASGAGKSSLTAWLTARGFDYLTDEMVFIPEGTLTVAPFVRPLSLKASARQTIDRSVINFAAMASRSLAGPEGALLQPSALGSVGRTEALELSAIVFPRFSAGAPLTAHALPKATTGLELMAGLVNARNLPGHGFQDVTRLARAVPGSRLEYGGFSQLESWADGLRAAVTQG